MTEYFLTVPHDTADEPTMESMQDLDPAFLEQMMTAVDAFNSALKESGAFRYAGGLQPPSTAKTVHIEEKTTRVLEEPFVAAPSYVGGFWIIEADDEATATAWAEQAARALGSRIEVRALQEELSED
ncbi:hypothetical protein GRS96_19725 (plasmid) [Rathayibacter sp. VKM Ac-2803]|uniref:YCII-related domain-containing protein n=1 Tax=Rathayibacter caricis DSM 15933 TaxID=1328867 RepID=A0A2T4UP63_9MICO|nr:MULTISPECIES: YciI family protein [Rathayibacter]MWV51497.1 hypothetical protein [Rathayibacter sp. VKM Ac-2803]PTL71322.1 hypothetical protein C1I63_19055 [Rathayibacter caricis DSM 15933]